MEDAHTTLLNVEDAEGTAFFAVYDGHGGSNVAKYSGEGLHKRIVADKAFAKGDFLAAIKNGFLEMDRALRYDPEYGGDSSGCTAITATITDKNVLYVVCESFAWSALFLLGMVSQQLSFGTSMLRMQYWTPSLFNMYSHTMPCLCACSTPGNFRMSYDSGVTRAGAGNAGDSRAVLGSDGTAIALSNDHKPVNKGSATLGPSLKESRRIVAAGGFVEYGRVNGSLALSRALGDFEFKMNATLGPDDQIVTANPVIVEHKLTEEDEFLVLACDGIWDCMTSQEVVTFVRKGISEKLPLDQLCEMTMDHCLASDSGMTGVGCDNMTMVIVAILNGKTLEEWYEHIAQRVAVRLGPADSKVRPNGDEDPETFNEETAEKEKEKAEATATSTEAEEPKAVETADAEKKEEQPESSV
ncbi:Protein phosphatase 2C 2 [Linnemannia elongata]|nr:Protein phosphatase 2C 2 [Linnemannia elongata]